MARKFDSQKYTRITNDLERMADGTRQHAEDAKLPREHFNEQALREEQTQIRNLRENFERQQIEADKSYDLYEAALGEAEARLRRLRPLLQGVYGKKSPTLQNFGVSPAAERRRSAASSSSAGGEA